MERATITRTSEMGIKDRAEQVLAVGLASAAMLAAGATPAFAAGNSTPGGERYDNNPGRQQAGEVGAQCDSGAGSGAFGYFGKDLNLAGGANGEQTGLNNSAVCGERQGNL